MFWKNDMKEGLEEKWHQNERPWYQCFWKDGKRDGPEDCWYDDGQLRYSYLWKDGKYRHKLL